MQILDEGVSCYAQLSLHRKKIYVDREILRMSNKKYV